MRKQFVLEKRDYRHFTYFLLVKKNPMRGLMTCWILLVFGIGLIRSLVTGHMDSNFSSFLLIFVVVMALVLVARRMNPRLQDMKKRQYDRFWVQVREDGWFGYSPITERSVLKPWAELEGIYLSKHCLFVFVSQRDGWIVPRRVFASKEEEAEFLGEVERCYRLATGKPRFKIRKRGRVAGYQWVIFFVILFFLTTGIVNYLVNR